jgi:hypothetical protein
MIMRAHGRIIRLDDFSHARTSKASEGCTIVVQFLIARGGDGQFLGRRLVRVLYRQLADNVQLV